MSSKFRFTGAVILTAIMGAAGGALAQEHEHSKAKSSPEPVLSVADFDGSGEVNDNDIRLIQAQVDSGEYIAFFDRNADGTLEEKDVAIAKSERGRKSQPVDQELALLFHNTKQYRDKARAIEAGFIPLTARGAGHGEHWMKHPSSGSFGYAFQPAHPAGLNYDKDGRLWGVFYYIGPSLSLPDGRQFPPRHDFRPLAEAPEGFTGDRDHWHWHAGVCVEGVNFENPTMNSEELNFREGLSPSECLPEIKGEGKHAFVTENARWVPKFHMLHVWLYEHNPNGPIGGTNPRLAQDATDPMSAEVLPHGKINPSDPRPDYQFKGGTLCAWLAEGGAAPDFCKK